MPVLGGSVCCQKTVKENACTINRTKIHGAYFINKAAEKEIVVCSWKFVCPKGVNVDNVLEKQAALWTCYALQLQGRTHVDIDAFRHPSSAVLRYVQLHNQENTSDAPCKILDGFMRKSIDDIPIITVKLRVRLFHEWSTAMIVILSHSFPSEWTSTYTQVSFSWAERANNRDLPPFRATFSYKFRSWWYIERVWNDNQWKNWPRQTIFLPH